MASVLAGCFTVKEVEQAAAYCGLGDAERNYAAVLAGAPRHAYSGYCMYCGHCAPCASGIDIGTVNKYLDLVQIQGAVPETVREHYALLSHYAGECIECGACETRCPFGVKVIEKMHRSKEVFGK